MAQLAVVFGFIACAAGVLYSLLFVLFGGPVYFLLTALFAVPAIAALILLVD